MFDITYNPANFQLNDSMTRARGKNVYTQTVYQQVGEERYLRVQLIDRRQWGGRIVVDPHNSAMVTWSNDNPRRLVPVQGMSSLASHQVNLAVDATVQNLNAPVAPTRPETAIDRYLARTYGKQGSEA